MFQNQPNQQNRNIRFANNEKLNMPNPNNNFTKPQMGSVIKPALKNSMQNMNWNDNDNDNKKDDFKSNKMDLKNNNFVDVLINNGVKLDPVSYVITNTTLPKNEEKLVPIIISKNINIDLITGIKVIFTLPEINHEVNKITTIKKIIFAWSKYLGNSIFKNVNLINGSEKFIFDPDVNFIDYDMHTDPGTSKSYEQMWGDKPELTETSLIDCDEIFKFCNSNGNNAKYVLKKRDDVILFLSFGKMFTEKNPFPFFCNGNDLILNIEVRSMKDYMIATKEMLSKIDRDEVEKLNMKIIINGLTFRDQSIRKKYCNNMRHDFNIENNYITSPFLLTPKTNINEININVNIPNDSKILYFFTKLAQYRGEYFLAYHPKNLKKAKQVAARNLIISKFNFDKTGYLKTQSKNDICNQNSYQYKKNNYNSQNQFTSYDDILFDLNNAQLNNIPLNNIPLNGIQPNNVSPYPNYFNQGEMNYMNSQTMKPSNSQYPLQYSNNSFSNNPCSNNPCSNNSYYNNIVNLPKPMNFSIDNNYNNESKNKDFEINFKNPIDEDYEWISPISPNYLSKFKMNEKTINAITRHGIHIGILKQQVKLLSFETPYGHGEDLGSKVDGIVTINVINDDGDIFDIDVLPEDITKNDLTKTDLSTPTNMYMTDKRSGIIKDIDVRVCDHFNYGLYIDGSKNPIDIIKNNHEDKDLALPSIIYDTCNQMSSLFTKPSKEIINVYLFGSPWDYDPNVSKDYGNMKKYKTNNFESKPLILDMNFNEDYINGNFKKPNRDSITLITTHTKTISFIN